MTTRFTAALFAILGCMVSTNHSLADTFGSGASSFDIEFVDIGNPGNPADTTGDPNPAGSVPYSYRIGKYEISEQMIDKANAEGGLGITKESRGANEPATSVNWFEAVKFVNWLNTSTGSTPAYKFDGSGNFQLWTPIDAGYNPNNLYRNSLARYFLPSIDEWYKAAYYDPVASVYYDYPTGSDVAPDGIDIVVGGDTNFDAVYFEETFNGSPNAVTDVGVLSPFGTAGQGGNVSEWQETDEDLLNDQVIPGFWAAAVRGGAWFRPLAQLASSTRFGRLPANDTSDVGFRVASLAIPEPGALLLGMVAGVVCLLPRGRRA